MTALESRDVLLVDGECRLCTTLAAIGQRLGVECVVRTLQSVDVAAWDIDAARAQNELALRRSDGSTLFGHEAVAGALMTGPWLARLCGRALGWKCVAPLARGTYQWVARRRYRDASGITTIH